MGHHHRRQCGPVAYPFVFATHHGRFVAIQKTHFDRYPSEIRPPLAPDRNPLCTVVHAVLCRLVIHKHNGRMANNYGVSNTNGFHVVDDGRLCAVGNIQLLVVLANFPIYICGENRAHGHWENQRSDQYDRGVEKIETKMERTQIFDN